MPGEAARTAAATVALVLGGMLAAPSAAGQEPVAGERGRLGAWHAAQHLRSEPSADSSAAVLLRAAELELVLARPERARAILSATAHLQDASPAAVLPLMGAVEYVAQDFERAGALFLEAAGFADGAERAILVAQAGDAFERAGLPDLAAAQYRRSAELAEDVAPWLALREARTTSDTAVAFALLAQVPERLRRHALEVWGDLLLAAGDSSHAVSAYVGAGRQGRAARLSLTLGDTVEARRLAYEAVAGDDTASVRLGLTVARATPPAQTPDELARLTRASRKLGDARSALRLAERAVADSAAPLAMVVLQGDLLAENGQRERALKAYARAAAGGGSEAPGAAYKRARLLVRMRRMQQGHNALRAFADRYPKHRRAPLALYLVADYLRDQGRHREADSLQLVIARRWSRDGYASRARFELASRRLTQGDTAAALALYRDESDVRGPQRRAAQYFAAALHAARGDTLEARGLWAALARSDSLGYYGTIAREAAGLPPMKIERAVHREPSPDAVKTLRLLDFLRAAGFREEEDVLVAAVVSDPPGSPSEWLDIAEGLIELGRMSEAVRLGWRAANAFTLNHPRVLRVIFPWPLRDAIEAEASEFGVDPHLVAALIRQESTFRVGVVSHAGAHGLMQLMAPTARAVARRMGVEWDRALLRVADANLHFGVAHFASLLKRYDGAIIPSLAAYNAGGTPVRRWLRYPEARDPARFVERIPYQETRGYLRTVIRNRALYRALYPPAEVEADGSP